MSTANLHLALDLGTTTLAGRLSTPGGQSVAEAKRPNPQAVLGSDIIRRLEAAHRGAAERLQGLLVTGLNELFAELRAAAGVPRTAIAAAAAAGNPGICHLLQRLPAAPLLFPPHRPPSCDGIFLQAAEFGLDLPVPLYLFPLVSGYVGGDLVAFLFGQPQAPATLYIDVGTNGEMAWFDGRNWWATSVAAGPAFEGGASRCGMALERGAVTAVRVVGERLELDVFGGGPPRGLAGSGLASAVAAAVEHGLVDAAGTIAAPLAVATNLARYITEPGAGRALRLYRDARCELLLTQEDIRQFQLAKAAIKAGAESLLRRAGAEPAAVRTVVVTGAFGLSLPPRVLKRVAMLPENMVNKARFAPGGALAGVGRMLSAARGREQVEALARRLFPYPLSGTPAFEKAFLAALDFPHQD